jgi:hypothetical protein
VFLLLLAVLSQRCRSGIHGSQHACHSRHQLWKGLRAQSS